MTYRWQPVDLQVIQEEAQVKIKVDKVEVLPHRLPNRRVQQRLALPSSAYLQVGIKKMIMMIKEKYYAY
jgi:hypothetical protein